MNAGKDKQLDSAIRGAVDALKEAAKQFRLLGDPGHATMCETHRENLDKKATVFWA